MTSKARFAFKFGQFVERTLWNENYFKSRLG